MKKVLIIFSLALTLIIGGALVLVTEINDWSLYNIKENVADLNVKQISETYKYSDFEDYPIAFNNGILINQFFSDFVDFEDYDDYFYLDTHLFNNLIEIVEDDNIEAGTFNLTLDYIADLGVNNCEFTTIIEDDNYSGNYKSNHRHMNSRHRRRNEMGQMRKHMTVHPMCNTRTSITSLSTLKKIMKHRQMPINMAEITVTINPLDRDKIVK